MKVYSKHMTGGCQCGAVRFASDVMLDNSHICHCRMCQKAVGNIFAALVAAPNDEIRWTRGEPAVFRSSDLAERGFCRDCGTPLFYRSIGGARTNFTLGSLDNPEDFPLNIQIGMEARMPWFEAAMSCADGGKTGDGDEKDWAEEIRLSNHQHPDHDTENWPIKA